MTAGSLHSDLIDSLPHAGPPESEGCPVGAHERCSFFAEEHGHALYRCEECRIVFVHPQPTVEELRGIYEERSLRAREGDYYGSYLQQEPGLREHGRFLLRLLGPPRGSRRLLEVGCGPGFFLDEARRVGWQVKGIELNRVHAAHAREQLGLEVKERDFGEGELEEASLDVICMFDLLSHLRDPRGSLGVVARGLAPEGRVFLQAGAKGENSCKPAAEDWETPLHLFHFTTAALRGLLAGEGFQIAFEKSAPKLRMPGVLGDPRLRWLKELARPLLPVARRVLHVARSRPVTDHSLYIIAVRGVRPSV